MTEDKDKRTGWLRALKAGDDVVVVEARDTRLTKVDAVTPTGRIKVGSRQFDHRGREMRGYTEWSRCHPHLLEANEESRATVRRCALLSRAERFIHLGGPMRERLSTLTDDQLQAIIDATKPLEG